MSLMLSSLSTVCDVVLGISIAYLLARTRVPFRGALDAVAMLPLALPGPVPGFRVSRRVFRHGCWTRDTIPYPCS